MILEQSTGEVRAAVTLDVFKRIGPIEANGWSLTQLKQKLNNAAVQLHGADKIFYVTDDAKSQLLRVPIAPFIRQLTPADESIFCEFEAAASKEDCEGASVRFDDWLVLGAFEGGRLVAAASTYQWDNARIADVGVLTLNRARRKGYATNLLIGCASRAMCNDFQLQYRCQVDNPPSSALAESLGLKLFGIWTAIAPNAGCMN